MDRLGKELIVLLVEDEASDVDMFHRAVKAAGRNVTVHDVSDGQEAMDYLTGKGYYEDRLKYPYPDLILLDLVMPRVGGTEFLEWCLEHKVCKHIPVVVWTGTNQGDKKQAEAIAKGARRIFIKPHHMTHVSTAIQDIYALGIEEKQRKKGGK